MHGLINYTIEQLVLRNFGQEKWEEIKKIAGIDEAQKRQFLVRMVYDDSMTYDLVMAANTVLGLPVPDILEAFGGLFFEICQESGYQQILQVLGSTTHDFLQNLDALHDHLSTIYPGMRAPSFRCSQPDADGTMILHYYSERPGLEDVVKGIVKAVAKHLHDSEVDVSIKSRKGENHDHAELAICNKYQSCGASVKPKLSTTSYYGFQRLSPKSFCKIFPFHVIFDERMIIQQSGLAINRILPAIVLPGKRVSDVFDIVRPHVDLSINNIISHTNSIHVLKTKHGAIMGLFKKTHVRVYNKPIKQSSAGSVTPSMYDHRTTTNEKSAEFTNATSPVHKTESNLHCKDNKSIMFSKQKYSNVTKPDISKKSVSTKRDTMFSRNESSSTSGTDGSPELRLRLKGQMYHMETAGLILFLCSPSIVHLRDLSDKGMYLSDLPLHDATRDLLLMSEEFSAEYELTKKLEILTDKLRQTYVELEDEKKKTDRLMYSILPPSVANALRHKRPVEARNYDSVSLMFGGIMNFSAFCTSNSDTTGAMKIVQLLNTVFTGFDVLVEAQSDVYKVESVGDKYMVASGLPEPCVNHAQCIGRLALDMFDHTRSTTDPNGCPITITIGIHSGELVTGVIGTLMPRYCLFGNTVNLTSRMETTGVKGRINVSEDAYRCFQVCNNDEFAFEYRGPVVMKGKKDPMMCWLMARASH